MTNDEALEKGYSAMVPALQGGPAYCYRCKSRRWRMLADVERVCKTVKLNARVLSDVLLQRGFDLVSGGTDNHLILVSLLHKDFSGDEASQALERAGITVNKNSVPNDTRSAMQTSGVRIGSSALTTLGMKEAEFELIAHRICDVLDDITNVARHAEIKKELVALLQKFSVYSCSTY